MNSYRHTENGRLYTLGDLLHLIHDTEGIDRIKFVTNYPRDMTEDLLQAVNDLPRVCRYLHVPLQSGCDDVLKRMKRPYSPGKYLDKVEAIRAALPEPALYTDLIVGFPGEDDEAFAILHLDAERRRRADLLRGVALFDGVFDVLGIAIRPAQDDQILQTPGDKQFAAIDKPQIAGTQEVAAGAAAQFAATQTRLNRRAFPS